MYFLIRPFHSTDADELWRLHVLTVLASGFSREVAEWDTDLHSINENYSMKGGCFLVIEAAEKRLIGMGGFIPTSKESVELKRMRVHPEVQRKGVGKAILEALELKATTLGYTHIHLDTANAQIQKFYRKNGYGFLKSEAEGAFEFYFYEKDLFPR
jgi:GNAT superfamily N-acetyltransferase